MASVKLFFRFSFLLFLGIQAGSKADPQDRQCQPREFIENSEFIVCVCNTTYCDDVTRIAPESGSYVMYTSSKSGLRFQKDKGLLKNAETDSGAPSLSNVMKSIEPSIELDRSIKYQTIEGFGGAVTDAAAINWVDLKNAALKQNLINSYFGKNGLEYNMIRTPIGGSDFSTRKYAYNEYPENDTLLSNFTLAAEDYHYKIPMIKAAMAAATSDIHIVSTVWSPPVWMKNTHQYSGYSQLLPEYYQTYAEYYLKYIEEYAAHNISIWAVTTGNEPVFSVVAGKFNSLGWVIDHLGKWIAQHLGPTIHKSRYDVKILACDDQRPLISLLVDMVIRAHPEADKYIDGIAVHWYEDKLSSPSILEETAKKYPDKFILATEASAGANPTDVKVVLGSWDRAVQYATDIMEDLNNYVVGWIDWNLDLDMIGGPNWSKNFVDSPIIVFAEDEEFVKQPMYYALGHFSKYIPRGSVRINTVEHALVGVKHVAFETPDDTVVIVLYNAGVEQSVKIKYDDQEASIKLAAASIVTVEMKF